MALIRTKLKQLRDADVRYISLVDRAATRIPFRVLKRDKETQMIDLMGVFKSDGTAKPYVSAVVVFAQKNEATATQVLEAIKKQGFITDRVQKSDEGETLVFAQTDQPKDSTVVRLSEQTLVSVANLPGVSGWVGDLIAKNGFVPDMKLATGAFLAQMEEIVSKSETPQADAAAVLTSFGEYLNAMVVLPTACYALDAAVTDIVQKCACEEKDEKDEVKKESEEEQKKRIKDHPPSEMAPCDEEDDQKPPPDAVEKSDKAEKTDKPAEKKIEKKTVSKADDAFETLLTTLKGIEERTTAQFTSLSKKVDAVTTEQAEQKKVLDGVVQKADTLNDTLKTTVAATPVSEDRPANANRMRVEKRDEDPRTGNFDTAFLRRNRR